MNENGYVWTGPYNKQNNNARTSNIFVHFSDVPARMKREILSSDVLRRWRNFFYYTHTTVPSQNYIFECAWNLFAKM